MDMITPETPAGLKGVSRQIWAQMRAGTSYEVPTDCGQPYSADFYTERIHFENLAEFLKGAMNDDDALFNYCDYADEGDYRDLFGTQPVLDFPSNNINDHYFSLVRPLPKLPPNIGFKYKNSKGEMVTASLSGRLNKRVCYLDGYGCTIRLDAAANTFSGTVRFFYEGTKQFRRDAKDTPEEGDYRIDDMYVAAEITTENLNDFLYLIKEIGGNAGFQHFRGSVAKRYADKIRSCKDSGELKVFYEHLPEAIMDVFNAYLPYKVMYSHIILLTEYDDTGIFKWFQDGSSSLINLLWAMKNVTLLYLDLCADPGLVNRIYSNLDGSSEIEGITMSNKIAFTNVLKALCTYHEFDGAEKHTTEFHYGPGYEFDANVAFKDDNEKEKDSVFLEQLKETSKYLPENTIHSPNGKYAAKVGGYTIKDTVTVHSGHYGPLDRVYLTDMTNGGTRTAVPALYIKALSDEEEWQDIHRNIRFGANILMLILGVASLGATSPLLLAAAYADIALAVGDLGVMAFEEKLKETPAGREFLEAWNVVMIAGGIATAGPLLVTKIYSAGTKVLRLAKEGKLITAMQDCLMQVVQKSKNIGIFVKGVPQIVFDTVKEFGTNFGLLLKAFQDAGALILKGQLKFARYEGKGYALVYKGEVIAQGTANDLIKKVRDIWKKLGKEDGIAKYLDDVVDNIRIPFINGFTKEKILAIPKGQRPDPSKYLDADYIQRYYKRFEQKVSYLVPTDVLDRWGRNVVGRLDGQFVMLKSELDELIKKSKGNISLLEDELGFERGALKGKKMSRIDIKQSEKLRMPTGNEVGANELWLPGGQLPKGYYEAVIDQIKKGNYIETSLKL